MSTMKSINFDTGLKTYAINGDEKNCIAINVSDPNLLSRIEDMQEQIDTLLTALDNFDKMTPKERADLDTEAKALIDKAFNADISSHVFGATSCFAPLRTGELFILEFLNAFLPVVEADLDEVMLAISQKSAEKAKKYIDNAKLAETETPESVDAPAEDAAE